MPILRLQNRINLTNLQNGLRHWDTSVMYDDLEINAISSPNNNSTHQPTSIPSPFARIALVKTAFSEVTQHGVNALAAYQQIVSDTLDVAEIFFTYNKWRNKIDIIRWDVANDLNALQQNHRQIYDTLRMFLQSDAEIYNFDRMQCIYILRHKDTGDVIGATSPSTLFFSTSNDLSSVDIDFGNKRKAFTSIVPLKDRPAIFQDFIYTWTAAYNPSRQVNGKTVLQFNEIEEYLQAQLPLINRTAEISNLRSNASNNLTNSYTQFRAPDVEILGNALYNTKDIPKDYLTDNDVLEDTIIRFPYKIKEDSFFNGNIHKNSSNSFLLPIKSAFFKYYTIDDLKENLKINQSGGVAEVELKIGNQTFKKDYKISDGSLIQARFDCALFPNIKFKKDEEAQYRFGLVCDYSEKDNFAAAYINIDNSIATNNTRSSVRNESRQLNYQMKNYSLEGSGFDYIEIKYKGVSSIVIPNFEDRSGNDTFTFAVDFGTTNTHIEYKLGTNTEQVFDISQNPNDDKQVHWLHGGETAMRDVFDEEFIPAYTDKEFKLPMRTALSYGQKVNWHNVYPFEKASVDELYEKRLNYAYNSIITDLKWSDNANNQQQVKVYIESILFMLRNKVILNYGDLANTKIRWFYPGSMDRNRFNNLKTSWEDAYQKHFGGSVNNIIGIPESIAPFNYYIKSGDASNLVTIDIGGETTDIVVSKGEEIDYITSFRFAANSIFGDGYAEAVLNKNGIVRQFFDEIKSELETGINSEDALFEIFDDMQKNRSSADIASFLFSLKDNKTVLDNGENLAANANLESKLSTDTTQEIVFIIFYASIIYHLAKLMKAKKSEMPDRIVFSGNGSRVISFFTDDKDLLERFTKLIFERVYNTEYNSHDLNIILNKHNPKEATCKGGFFADEHQTYRDVFKKNVVLHSNGTNALIEKSNELTEENIKQNSYQIIDENYLNKTVEESHEFLDFFFKLLPFFDNEGYSLNDKSISIAKEVCSKNRLGIYAENGWRQKKREVKENDLIQETMFFYPLVGMLKELTDAIYNNQKQ